MRLTLASVLAMAVAAGFSLQNPWWAAMTVWMVGQPPRGLLLERSLAQLVGTLLGATAGAGLMLLCPNNPAIAVLGLSVWIAFCCGAANAMRHQRAYGAALCGLTTAVIVSLTLTTPIDPVEFAAARAADNLIGIGAAILVAFTFTPSASKLAIEARTRTVTSQALAVIGEALTETADRSLERERSFLLSLASLEASAEDAAAGSIAARRKLREFNVLFASLLDLIVGARAIRSREAPSLALGHADVAPLRMAFGNAAEDVAAGRDFDVRNIQAASQRLEAADPVLSPVLGEMRALLKRAADSHEQLGTVTTTNRSTSRWSIPHPDTVGLRLAVLRGAIASFVAGVLWLSIGWEPLRYLMLGTCIFTVLFSMADEPALAIRQVFLGAVGAAVAALLWRTAIVPEVENGWLSLGLTVPLVFIASLLQAKQGTVFLGLAFNMLFAILARPVDTHLSDPINLTSSEAMLLVGISFSYVSYRWLLPMDTNRRRRNLRAAIRREIAAISIRAETQWAERHLARLRYLVFSLAVRSRGQVHEVEDALAALSLGHVLFRLGNMRSSASIPESDRLFAGEVLRLVAAPMDAPEAVARTIYGYATQIGHTGGTNGFLETEASARLKWLLEVAAQDLAGHASIFVSSRTTPAAHPQGHGLDR